jgi:Membrane domain of glycerophosphoryl diester phosphodiesterase
MQPAEAHGEPPEATMTNPELRPLSLAELLDRVFTLYRSHFWLFVGIMLIPSLILVPVNLFLFGAQRPFATNPTPAAAKAMVATFLFVIFGFVVAFWVVHTVGLAATTHAVSEVYLGRASTVRGAYGKIRGRFWRLMLLILSIMVRVIGLCAVMGAVLGLFGALLGVIGSAGAAAGIVAGLLIIVIFMGCGVAAIYLLLRYAVCIPALMIENLKAGASIRRSIELTKGRRGQIFLASFMATLLTYVAAMIFQGPFLLMTVALSLKGQTPIWLAALSTLSGAIGAAISSPILMIVLVLFYYDLRVRKEAFDLQLLMSSLGPSEAAAAAPSV